MQDGQRLTNYNIDTISLTRIDEFIFVVPTCYEKKGLTLFLKPEFPIFSNFGTGLKILKLSIKSLKKRPSKPKQVLKSKHCIIRKRSAPKN